MVVCYGVRLERRRVSTEHVRCILARLRIEYLQYTVSDILSTGNEEIIVREDSGEDRFQNEVLKALSSMGGCF